MANKMDKIKMYQRGMSREEARAKLTSLIGGPYKRILLKNDHNGEEVILSNPSVGKMLSATAVRKSEANGFTKERHFAVVSDICELFKASVKVLSHPDKNNSKDITIHRFAAPLHFDNAVVYITVKESAQDGKRIYSAELMETKKLGGTLEKARGLSRTPPSPSFHEKRVQDRDRTQHASSHKNGPNTNNIIDSD